MIEVAIRHAAAQRRWYASVDGSPEFLVGREVAYQSSRGLVNTVPGGAPPYSPGDFPSFGHWAVLCDVTAYCETRRSFLGLNTYDRARFTFGLLQFAAHVPNGHFVKFLRRLLTLPVAAEYFPELALRNERVVRRTAGAEEALETDATTAPLQAYLNPTGEQVDPLEVERAARLLHFTANHEQARLVQVDVGISLLKTAMREYATRYALDGQLDTICCAVADIRHQGRANSEQIREALQSSDPLEALIQLGAAKYPARVRDLGEVTRQHVERGTLGVVRYQRGTNDFA